jgi:hypothetical protein
MVTPTTLCRATRISCRRYTRSGQRPWHGQAPWTRAYAKISRRCGGASAAMAHRSTHAPPQPDQVLVSLAGGIRPLGNLEPVLDRLPDRDDRDHIYYRYKLGETVPARNSPPRHNITPRMTPAMIHVRIRTGEAPAFGGCGQDIRSSPHSTRCCGTPPCSRACSTSTTSGRASSRRQRAVGATTVPTT